jgi:hypothetical protein
MSPTAKPRGIASGADTVMKKEGQLSLPFNMLDKPAIKSS